MTMFHTTAPFWEIWRAWFLSDGVGLVMVAPLVVGLGQSWRELPPRGQLIEGVAVVGLLVLTSMYILSHPTTSWVSFSLGALVLPLLLWLAARCHPTLRSLARSSCPYSYLRDNLRHRPLWRRGHTDD